MAKTFRNRDEALEYVNTLPIGSIINLCVDLLMERNIPKRISITEEQFKTMFRITGIREDGTIENRGRRKTEPEIFED